MEPREYLTGLASQLVHELEPILSIKGVTDNPDLLGSYTEACIRRLAHRIVSPMRVSTGAVLDFPLPSKLPQLDVVLWAPFPAPAVYEVEDFALVPRSSCFGVIEIKRSNYSGTDIALEDFLDNPGPIVAEPDQKLGDTLPAVLGIVSVLENVPSGRMKALIDAGRVVAFFKRTATGLEVRAEDVLRLVNFLQYISWRYRIRCAQPWAPQVDLQSLHEPR